MRDTETQRTDMDTIIAEIRAERERQKSLVFGGKPSTDFDRENSQGDWIGYIVRYASGAYPRLGPHKDLEFRQAMVKVAALAVAAIENHDAGFCS